MNGIDKLAHIILHKKNIDDCGLHELQSLARQYPYFSPLHLLLAERIKTLDESLYEHQLEKTSLYMHNPVWFQYLVSGQPGEQQTLPDYEEEKVQELAGNHHLPTTAGSTAYGEEKSTVKTSEEDKHSAAENETLHVTMDEQVNTVSTDELPVTEATEESLIPEDELSDTEDEEEEYTPANDSEQEFKIPALRIEPLKATENDLLFEPYHTVDYFASQGIKDDQAARPVDRFSYQLKSFTEWIKTMKRLPANELESNMDSHAEEKVQSLATHSVQENMVYTETMAEVWIKQGDKQKAMDIYHKLSLQNPAKSPYFAAKIESLKNS